MALNLYITNVVAGESLLYEKKRRRGLSYIVKSYWLYIFNESGQHVRHRVSRDTYTDLVYPPTSKYGTNQECPPHSHGNPYKGRIITQGDKGFRIGIYEDIEGFRENNTILRGRGDVLRHAIQIHVGPGNSEGCFLLTGGIRGRDDFERSIHSLIEQDRECGVSESEELLVHVAERQ